tara:strand:+ start:1315 stop:1893 length:579 start_codon:yes stop_codon:yes gene_type:complete
MKNILLITTILAGTLFISACGREENSEQRDTEVVQRQQSQYQIAQPMPVFDWSLERQLVIDLYQVRNQKVATHSVWRSDRGLVEGDCPSYGYGIPYDTSLTNPLAPTTHVYEAIGVGRNQSTHTVEQAEPNGVFASKNTAATWVMCLGEVGMIEPVYVETKVTVYPGPVVVDYDNNRVTRSGAATVLIPTGE